MIKKRSLFLVWTVVLLFAAAPGSADIYKWVDENGVLNFSDVPPTAGKAVESVKSIDSPDPSPVQPDARPAAPAAPASQKSSDNRVEIFTTEWCKYCKQAIAFLQANRIKYTQYDVETNPYARKRKKDLGGGKGVPFAVINGRKISGFSEKTYRQVLGLP